MEIMNVSLYETVSVILFGIGFMNLLLQNNLIKKIIGLNIMDTSVYLFLASKGFIEGRHVTILQDNIHDVEHYMNPIPSGLVLTGIVVSVSMTAFALILVQMLYRHYGTINMNEITTLQRQKEGN